MSDIVKRNRDLPVQGMNDLVALGDKLAQSGMLGVTNPAAGLVVASTCYMEGITPIEFGRKYHIIGGRPTMKPSAMAAEFRQKGGDIEVVERSATRAAAVFSFEGRSKEYEFTIEDANRAELTDGKNANWRKYPQNMLWARLISNTLDVICPEIRYGIYTPEEMEDVIAEESVVQSPPQSVDPVEAAKAVQAEVVEDVQVDYSRNPMVFQRPDGSFTEPNAYSWVETPQETINAILSGEIVCAGILEGHFDYIRAMMSTDV